MIKVPLLILNIVFFTTYSPISLADAQLPNLSPPPSEQGRMKPLPSERSRDNTRQIDSKEPELERSLSLEDAKKFIPNFEIRLDTKHAQAELIGNFPSTCKSHLSLKQEIKNNTSAQKTKSVALYRLVDTDGKGIDCLKKNAESCEKISCTSFADLYNDLSMREQFKPYIDLGSLAGTKVTIAFIPQNGEEDTSKIKEVVLFDGQQRELKANCVNCAQDKIQGNPLEANTQEQMQKDIKVIADKLDQQQKLLEKRLGKTSRSEKADREDKEQDEGQEQEQAPRRVTRTRSSLSQNFNQNYMQTASFSSPFSMSMGMTTGQGQMNMMQGQMPQVFQIQSPMMQAYGQQNSQMMMPQLTGQTQMNRMTGNAMMSQQFTPNMLTNTQQTNYQSYPANYGSSFNPYYYNSNSYGVGGNFNFTGNWGNSSVSNTNGMMTYPLQGY